MKLLTALIMGIGIPGLAGAQGLGVSISLVPERAFVGEQVEASGYLHYFNENPLAPLYVSEALFVVHHGGVSQVTPNLLPQPVPLLWWEVLRVSTNITIQPEDPHYLHVEFIVGSSLDPDGANVFRNQFPGQILVMDAVHPALAIAPSGPGRLSVAWPMQYRGWQLESTTDLGLSWFAVTNAVQIDDESCRVELPRSMSERLFLRLRR